mgnify:CR=1 FL=1
MQGAAVRSHLEAIIGSEGLDPKLYEQLVAGNQNNWWWPRWEGQGISPGPQRTRMSGILYCFPCTVTSMMGQSGVDEMFSVRSL